MIDRLSLKFVRALHHLNELQAAADDWIKLNNCPTWLEPDPATPGYFLLKARADDVPPDPFSLLIGDVLQCLRSGLDHLVYAVAVADCHPNPLPDDIAKDSQFPIIGDENRKGVTGCGETSFSAAAGKDLKGVKKSKQAVIKGLQPFRLGPDFRSHPLWRLNVLTSIDKHRLLHTTGAFNAGGLYIDVPKGAPSVPFIGSLTVFTGTGLLKQEAVIARMALDPAVTSQAEMEMRLRPVVKIVFTDGPAASEDIAVTLAGIYNYIVTDVIPAMNNII